MKNLLHGLWLIAGTIFVFAACGGAPEQTGSADVSRDAIAGYLEELGLNTAGVADNITFALRNGQSYREKITDKYNHTTMLTAWMEKQTRGSTFCMSFYRDEKCPDCNGTGQVAAPAFINVKSQVAFNCRRCSGTGILKNQFHRQCYILGTEEFINPQVRREREQQSLPPEVLDYARQLASDTPAERLAACEWLDKNFIRIGQFFEDLRPVLDRAQYFGRDDVNTSLTQKIMGKKIGDSGKTVYQFLAGRGVIGAGNRAYYRIYIDNNSGSVVQKQFIGEQTNK